MTMRTDVAQSEVVGCGELVSAIDAELEVNMFEKFSTVVRDAACTVTAIN
ncbi:MAG: hypothetical protein QOG80_2576 [Pseudonocardiales bacterium]|jgi:hypothetical protein|nr:hypothetical protein [Pseudonocardiales bacterium]